MLKGPKYQRGIIGMAAAGTMAGAKTIAGGLATPQPTFSNVVWLMGFEGGTGTSPFTEESNNGWTVTPTSSATRSSAQAKFGSNSGDVVGGTLSRFSISDNAILEVGSSDFSVEGFYRLDDIDVGDHSFYCCWHPSTEKTMFWWWDQSAGVMRFDYSLNGTTEETAFTSSWSPVADTWYHLAVCRSGTNLRMFVDGVQIGSTHNIGSVTLHNSTREKHVGYSNDNTRSLNGYVDEFRFVIGEGIYTESFQVPTSAHPRS